MSLIFNNYEDNFSSLNTIHKDEEKCRTLMRQLKKKVPPPYIAPQLDGDIREEEMPKAIKSLKNNKRLHLDCPHLDDLSLELFKVSHLTKPLLLVCQEASQYKPIPNKINEGVIKLIHKRGEKTQLSNQRPISMLCTIYKILDNTLTNQLSSHLTHWIRKEQKGFVTNAIIALWEGIGHVKEEIHIYDYYSIW